MVARNVMLDGGTLAPIAIGGLGLAELEGEVDRLADATGDLEVVVEAPDRELMTTSATAGIALDGDEVVSRALAVGREGSPLDQITNWLQGFSAPRRVESAYTFDEDAFAAWLDAEPAVIASEPVEPWFTGESGELELSPPVPGQRLDVAATTAAVADAVGASPPPVRVAMGWTPIPTRIDEAGFQAGVDEAERLARSALTLRVGNQVARLGPETIRRWIRSEEDGDRLRAVFVDGGAVHDDAEEALADIQTEGVDPVFSIVDGEVAVEFGEPPERCCDGDVTDMLFEAASDGTGNVVVLPLVAVEDAEAQAARFGIREVVGEFTTNHACCENRVTNIQRMADIVRGTVIPPGGEFSLNGHVGRRTRENGFVPAGAIAQGHFRDEVGGGVSQFATTLFNAAFFAGLDIPVYQSHTIYISRYPYGREATVSWPAPDLQLVNDTPYAMMLWPTYTGSSITMQIWSTPYFDVEQTGQRSYGWGAACTRVETDRRRTSPDGEVLEDTFLATYRPAEGVDCAGNPTPEPDD